jgi:hypothetical protein
MEVQVRLSSRRRLGTFRLGETVAHSTPTGFWSVWQPDVSLLLSEFQEIWEGEGGTFRACDRVYFAYISSDFWGHQGEEAPAWFDWPDATKAERDDAWRNASAWVGNETNPVCALSEVAAFNQPGNPRTIRAVISRFLYGLYKNHGWSLTKLAKYVERICDRLNADPELKNACMGWSLMDDTFPKAVASPTDLPAWEQAIDAVHSAQKSRGLNLPFFFNFSLDQWWVRVWDVTNPPQSFETNPYPPPSARYYRWAPPCYVLEAIHRKSSGGRFPDDDFWGAGAPEPSGGVGRIANNANGWRRQEIR